MVQYSTATHLDVHLVHVTSFCFHFFAFSFSSLSLAPGDPMLPRGGGWAFG